MLDRLEDVDVVEAGEALESVYNHVKTSMDAAEKMREYDSVTEFIENEEETMVELREVAEDSYITQVYTDIEEELQSAYEAADWT